MNPYVRELVNHLRSSVDKNPKTTTRRRTTQSTLQPHHVQVTEVQLPNRTAQTQAQVQRSPGNTQTNKYQQQKLQQQNYFNQKPTGSIGPGSLASGPIAAGPIVVEATRNQERRPRQRIHIVVGNNNNNNNNNQTRSKGFIAPELSSLNINHELLGEDYQRQAVPSPTATTRRRIPSRKVIPSTSTTTTTTTTPLPIRFTTEKQQVYLVKNEKQNQRRGQNRVEVVQLRPAGHPSRPEPRYQTPEPYSQAVKCNPKACRLPDCYCGGTEIPGINSF